MPIVLQNGTLSFMNFLPLSDEDRASMLSSSGLDEKELFRFVCRPSFRKFEALSEREILADVAALSVPLQETVSGLSIGAYFMPAVVNSIASRGEFVTAYTPYQPECSQGTLTAIFEFQTRVCELSGLDVSNAGLYDGSTAVVEAVLMAMAETGRHEVVVSRAAAPATRAVLATHLLGRQARIIEAPFDLTSGKTASVTECLSSSTAAVIIASPNVFGVVENEIAGHFAEARAVGAVAIQIFHPMAVTILPRPADVGAEIAVAEGQPLGIALSAGGPFLGLIAANSRFMRRMPGRIVGLTKDAEGRDAYVLTLQTREQHIRRERATSNICTNQALMALRFTVCVAALGIEGIRAEAIRLHEKAEALSRGKRVFTGEIFNEFVARDDLRDAGFPPGIPLGYPELPGVSIHGVAM